VIKGSSFNNNWRMPWLRGVEPHKYKCLKGWRDEMNFRYAITYGKPSPKLDTSKPDEIKKAFNRLTKDVEKLGLKIVFWGSPWGVSEGFVIVFDFNKNIVLYEKLAMSTEIEWPITDNRTDLVFEW